jgi:hypothetical protein
MCGRWPMKSPESSSFRYHHGGALYCHRVVTTGIEPQSQELTQKYPIFCLSFPVFTGIAAQIKYPNFYLNIYAIIWLGGVSSPPPKKKRLVFWKSGPSWWIQSLRGDFIMRALTSSTDRSTVDLLIGWRHGGWWKLPGWGLAGGSRWGGSLGVCLVLCHSLSFPLLPGLAILLLLAFCHDMSASPWPRINRAGGPWAEALKPWKPNLSSL